MCPDIYRCLGLFLFVFEGQRYFELRVIFVICCFFCQQHLFSCLSQVRCCLQPRRRPRVVTPGSLCSSPGSLCRLVEINTRQTFESASEGFKSNEKVLAEDYIGLGFDLMWYKRRKRQRRCKFFFLIKMSERKQHRHYIFYFFILHVLPQHFELQTPPTWSLSLASSIKHQNYSFHSLICCVISGSKNIELQGSTT